MRILSDVAKNMRFLIIVIAVAAVFGTAHARAAGRVIGDSDIVTLPETSIPSPARSSTPERRHRLCPWGR